MSKINVNNLSNENDDGAPEISGISTFSSNAYFVPPVGTTTQRPDNPEPGALRFNTDIGSLEYYKGDTLGWSYIEMTSPNLGINNNSAGTSGGLGTRGVIGGSRNNPTYTSLADSEYITISTLGNGIDFGNMVFANSLQASCSSETIGLFGGGYLYPATGTGSYRTNKITGWHFASLGSHADFSITLSNTCQQAVALSNSTRGIFSIGSAMAPSSPTGYINTLDYLTIATSGNAADFGDIVVSGAGAGTVSSSTRGVFAGGYGPGIVNTIQYVTIASTGDAQDFGDLPGVRTNSATGGNATRGIIAGGTTPSVVNTIEYITIATTGNAQDFGDMTVARTNGVLSSSLSSSTRTVFAGGTTPSISDIIEYVQNASLGNAKDFGDLTEDRAQCAGASNGHGGL